MLQSIETIPGSLSSNLQRLYNEETYLKESISRVIQMIRSHNLRSILIRYWESADNKRLILDQVLETFPGENSLPRNEILEKLLNELDITVNQNSEEILDVLVVPLFQQICYHKLSAYKTAQINAIELQLDHVADLLQEIIDSEENMDDLLMKLVYQEFRPIEMNFSRG